MELQTPSDILNKIVPGDAYVIRQKFADRLLDSQQFNLRSPGLSNITPIPSTYDMWRAYAVAPVVTPLTFIAIVSLGGVTMPANVIGMGFLACYLVAGLIGMPIAFWLRRRDSLNAWTIHGAALSWGVVWSLFCIVVVIDVVAAIGGSIDSFPLLVAWIVGIMVPPVVLAGTSFWFLITNPKWI